MDFSPQQAKARNLGLTLAMVMRVGLVFLAGWIITLKEDIVVLFGMGFSVKDFILIAGGLFLIYKAVSEIHHKLEAVLAATTKGSGAVGLSRHPVAGSETQADAGSERHGLG